jgi:hypothetical protein
MWSAASRRELSRKTTAGGRVTSSPTLVFGSRVHEVLARNHADETVLIIDDGETLMRGDDGVEPAGGLRRAEDDDLA